jgi:hypothetical protein
MVALTDILAGNLADIARACQASDVKRLDLFGSCARPDSTRDSDADFLVEFKDPLRAGLFDRFLALHRELERITGRRVDLLESSSLENPVLRRRIQQDRKLIYAA